MKKYYAITVGQEFKSYITSNNGPIMFDHQSFFFLKQIFRHNTRRCGVRLNPADSGSYKVIRTQSTLVRVRVTSFGR